MNTAIISLGSNIDPDSHIPQAKKLLAREFRLIKESSLMRTKPIGIPDQPDFINGVVMIETDLNEKQTTSILKELEDRLGRDRTAPKSGPRTIDLDLLIWNDEIVDQDDYERPFNKKFVSEMIKTGIHHAL